jgi:hypothetical protein
MRLISANNDLAARRSTLEELEARLHHGEAMINQLRAENKPIGALEGHWLTLLRQYEIEFRSMQEAA